MTMEKIIMVGIIIFAFAVGFLSVHYTMTEVTDSMLNTTVINSSNATVTSIEGSVAMLERLDYVIFGLFIGLVLALIVGAFFASLHPILMFIYFIIVLLAIIISAVLSNVWNYIGNDSVFVASVSSFPITSNLMAYLPIYITVVGFVGIVIMFAKPYIIKN